MRSAFRNLRACPHSGVSIAKTDLWLRLRQSRKKVLIDAHRHRLRAFFRLLFVSLKAALFRCETRLRTGPKSHFYLFAAGLLGAFSGCRNEFAEIGVNLKVISHRLSNGLQVLVVEDARVPMIAFQTWVRVGSSSDPEGRTGMAQLFEHLYFRGTQKVSGEDLVSKLESLGIESGSLVSRDFTVYYHLLQPQHLDAILEIESDRLMGLNLSDEVVRQDRLLMLESRRVRVESNIEARMSEALWSLAFRSHPYRWPVGGYPPDVLNLTGEAVREYYKAVYRPSNVTLVVGGKIASADVIERIKKVYGGLPALPATKIDFAPEPAQREERRFVIREDATSARLSIGYPITSAQEDDSFALDIAANILFEGNSARIPTELIRAKPLLLAATGMAHTPRFGGLFSVHLVVRDAKTEAEVTRVENEFYSTLSRVTERGFSEEEVKSAVIRLTTELLDSARSLSGMTQFLGTVHAVLGISSGFTRDFSKYLQIRPADVRRVMGKYLDPNNRSVVVLLPKSKEDSSEGRVPEDGRRRDATKRDGGAKPSGSEDDQ